MAVSRPLRALFKTSLTVFWLSVNVARDVRVGEGQEIIVTCKPAFKLCDVVVTP